MGFKQERSRGLSGRLQRRSLSAPCKVLDVSEDGVLIESCMVVKPGEALELVIDLEQGSALTCGLEVNHLRSAKFSAKITLIRANDRDRLFHIFDDDVEASVSRR